MKRIVSIISLGLLFVACGQTGDTDIEEPTVEVPATDTRVSFVGVGDNIIHETVYKDARQDDGTYDFTKMYTNIKPEIESADIAFINQETIPGGEALGLSGYPMFNSPDAIAKNVEEAGFDMVNLATNHSLDVKDEGIVNALKVFANTNLIYTGIFASQEDAQNIKTFTKDGITFSFLAYTYGTNGMVSSNSYSVSYLDEEKIKEDVRKAKEISDVVIVSAHWGEENSSIPTAYQTSYAKVFADAGVDLVIGTHPHVIQPVEWIEGVDGNKTLVAYSLGNFMGGMLDVDNAIGGLLSLDFVKSDTGISIENVKWKTAMIHFEGNQQNILEERYNYTSYLLDDYTDEMMNKHVLNGYNGQPLTRDYINAKVKEVIAEEFLK